MINNNGVDEKIQDEIVQQENEEQVNKKEEKQKPKKKKKVGKIILNIVTTIIFIVVVLDIIVGVINMQRISNEEEPIWYLSTKTTETELKTVTEYHLGLYKIVKTDTARKTETTLKPFFIGD